MTPEEVKEASRMQRLRKYKMICFCGVALMLWSNKAASLNSVHQFNSTSSYFCTLYFTVSLVCMMLGIIAASFPNSAPYAVAISWNGALQAFLVMIVSFHLNIAEYYTKEQHMVISVLVTSVVFTVFWCFCTRDPPEPSRVTIKRS